MSRNLSFFVFRKDSKPSSSLDLRTGKSGIVKQRAYGSLEGGVENSEVVMHDKIVKTELEKQCVGVH